MLEREQSVSTVMGEGVAIPHGTNESKGAVLRNALSFTRFPDGVDWNGKPVTIAIGIAAQGNDHVGILSKLAMILVDPEKAEQLRNTTDPQQVLDLLTPTKEMTTSEGRGLLRTGRRAARGRPRAHARTRRGQAPHPQLLHLRH